jgi:uncharacterized protein
MRSLPNEPADEPERRCVISGERGPKSGLVRLALGPDGQVAPDVRARAGGRGAWIGVNRADLETAIAKGKLKGGLSRAFKTSEFTLPDDLADRVETALSRNAIDRLGLEARSGMLLTGSEKIEQSARSGKVRLLLHASDAAADGNRKLDQAWRVGSDREGTTLAGLVLSVDRSILAASLGRENVVHIALIDKAAAARVGQALDRWHYFIGREIGSEPCEIDRKGSPSDGAQNVSEGL